MRARFVSSLAGAALLSTVALGTGCANAGESRVLAIQATGTVTGLVYLDRNGDHRPNPADTVLAGVGIRLVARGTRDTVARATSNAQGDFSMAGVPVGHYLVAVDTATVGDSVEVVRIDTSAVALTPADSADTVQIAIGFPIVTIAQAQLLPPGARAFIEGVSLNGFLCAFSGCFSTFGDSTVHVTDSSGSIRATRVKVVLGNSVGTGDSVRFLGTRSARAGQPTWDNVTPVILAIGPFAAATTPTVTTNAAAKTANGGLLDAALVRILGDTVIDTLTLVAGADTIFQLTTFDGTDTLFVALDNPAFSGFGAVLPDSVRRFTGLLVPSGTGGWRLKPRSGSDIVP